MKLFPAVLIFLYFASCVQGGQNCKNDAYKDICEEAGVEIDQNGGEEKTKAKKVVKKCIESMSESNPQLLTDLRKRPEYITNFATLAVTKARKYWKKPTTIAEKAFDGKQRLDFFSRMVYDELRPALEEGSTFPVASGEITENKRAATELLRRACNVSQSCVPELNWAKVENNICGGDGNWKLKKMNTVHNIFVESLIPAFTAKALADEQGLQRIEKANNVGELVKRWERVTALLMGLGKWKNYHLTLEEVCVDTDMPDLAADRQVFVRLAAMAVDIESMDDGGCPGDQENIMVPETPGDDYMQVLEDAFPMAAFDMVPTTTAHAPITLYPMAYAQVGSAGIQAQAPDSEMQLLDGPPEDSAGDTFGNFDPASMVG